MQTDSRVPVDLTNCDREPIHLLGTVQPFGFLVAVSRADWVVTRASRNVDSYLGTGVAELIGRPLIEVFTASAIHTIRGHLQAAVMGDATARAFGLVLTATGMRCDVAVHLTGDTVVIECEPSVEELAGDAGAKVTAMIARLQQTNTLRALYRIAAREMRALTGFDRVMVYQFDEDGSGEVVAESVDPGREPFLGLHYPASDIPRQARILYERNWLRIIADVAATPAPIEPELDRAGQPLDLSRSVLRSVSSIHIDYLRNMGVQASMSVSILREGRLWGLFACHHYAPHHLPFSLRTAAELFGQMFSLLMENRERQGEATYQARAQTLHNRLVTVMASEATRFESIVAHIDDIADLLTCDGIGVWINERATLKGLTPNEQQFIDLVGFLARRGIDEVHARREIGAEHPPGRAFADRAAGMLVVPLSRPARDYLVFFRREVARSVDWAGDPAKPVTVGPLGARLTPRKSFELWKETVRGQSLPWQSVECRIAESLRVSLLEVILRLSDITEAERRRAQERHELLIAELNHRVRNILSLIRGIVSLSQDSTSSVEAFTKVIGGRIQALARAHDQITADNWAPASFHGTVSTEAGAYLAGKSDRIVIAGPDVLLEPDALTTVALVFHEMITNSAKYGALSDNRGRVDITTSIEPSGHFAIAWSEIGGPPVKPPAQRGFGSTVIERSIPNDLKGEARVEFALAGLRAWFTIPASQFRLAPVPPENGRRAAEPAVPRGTLPASVLLVEDNLIIALDTEDILRRLGVDDVRTVGSVAEALRAIEERAPGFALLDVNLGSESSFEIAEQLTRLKVGFAFATGYGEQIAFPREFASSPRLRKPYSADALLAALQGQSPGNTPR